MVAGAAATCVLTCTRQVLRQGCNSLPGSHHLDMRGLRKLSMSSLVHFCPSALTHTSSGRSVHFLSGMAITAASATCMGDAP